MVRFMKDKQHCNLCSSEKDPDMFDLILLSGTEKLHCTYDII